MTAIPPWDFGSPAAAPFGLPMCQNRRAIPAWSYAMEKYPPARIIEIGTYAGGFITALALHAWWIGATVISYDIARPHERVVQLAAKLGVTFATADVWTRVEEIGRIIASPGRTFVLCDGGNKPRELATFATFLKPGDVIAAHDYVPIDGPQGDAVHWPCSEIAISDVQPTVDKLGLVPFMQDHFDEAAWLAYRRSA